jgi:hypothetical protein
MGLIDATKAIESIDEIACSMSVCINTDYCHGMTAMKDAAIHAVENQPTVDAVPVDFINKKIVELQSCAYQHFNDGHEILATCVLETIRLLGSFLKEFTHADWFCADGERRTDGNE